MAKYNTSELGRLYPGDYGVPWAKGMNWAVVVTNTLKSKAKKHLAKRGLPWTLTLVEAFELMIAPCTYCGRVFELPDHGGIDRVDSDQGYTPENCVPACFKCNSAKNAQTVSEFADHVARMYHHLASKGLTK